MNNKRKAPEQDPKKQQDSSDEDSDGTVQDIVDVDFDFYNPEEVDYHALKRLLSQLFSSDAELIQIGDLADIIIEENHVGTTIKVDGQESDPYAILSVINLKEQKENQGVSSLCQYLSNKCPKKDQTIHKTIMNIFSLEKPVGWIVSERFINMPVEVMPPMYNLLQQEMKNAVDNNEPYSFEWYMFIVKVYKEVSPSVDEEEDDDDETSIKNKQPPSKKKKGKKSSGGTPMSETFYFQAEDEIIASYASHQFDFKFTNSEKEAASDSKRAFSEFGIAPSRKLLFVHHSKFANLVDEIEKTCSNITPVS
ncbi:p21-C-terminal region-binding protein-domain-containing protein [Halteromyces radiatus]|uniref:p21-C-terminal region-binding protein-domain-containing protein n=1 Tax=Halteromyces radiatus TaxID=101107 RepID=UPI00221EA0FA|nr:p21-C-terminal region-binding protein-domain-containing protein [Halteromyces radiatus]KAI8084507.1 p21-C-terminal region-binding protein-domain-containing protein [Halteromyces radiatus]